MKTMCKRCKGYHRIQEFDIKTGTMKSIRCPACKGSGKAENYSFPDGKKL